ncbi:MAG: hypothetical protein C5S41_10225, partial [Candidatus Methanomarinus sp.]|jgi:hypothetical protein
MKSDGNPMPFSSESQNSKQELDQLMDQFFETDNKVISITN